MQHPICCTTLACAMCMQVELLLPHWSFTSLHVQVELLLPHWSFTSLHVQVELLLPHWSFTHLQAVHAQVLLPSQTSQIVHLQS
jgi:hypothetical protein